MNYEYKYYLYKKKYLDLKEKVGGARLPTIMEILYTCIKIYLSNIGMSNVYINGDEIRWRYYAIKFFQEYNKICLKIYKISHENINELRPENQRLEFCISLSDIRIHNRELSINIPIIGINNFGDTNVSLNFKYIGTDYDYHFLIKMTDDEHFMEIDDSDLESITNEDFKNMLKLLISVILFFYSELKKNGMINNQIN